MPPCRHLELRLPYLTLPYFPAAALPYPRWLPYFTTYFTVLPLLYISSSSADLILSQIFDRNFTRKYCFCSPRIHHSSKLLTSAPFLVECKIISIDDADGP